MFTLNVVNTRTTLICITEVVFCENKVNPLKYLYFLSLYFYNGVNYVQIKQCITSSHTMTSLKDVNAIFHRK